MNTVLLTWHHRCSIIALTYTTFDKNAFKDVKVSDLRNMVEVSEGLVLSQIDAAPSQQTSLFPLLF